MRSYYSTHTFRENRLWTVVTVVTIFEADQVRIVQNKRPLGVCFCTDRTHHTHHIVSIHTDTLTHRPACKTLFFRMLFCFMLNWMNWPRDGPLFVGHAEPRVEWTIFDHVNLPKKAKVKTVFQFLKLCFFELRLILYRESKPIKLKKYTNWEIWVYNSNVML